MGKVKNKVLSFLGWEKDDDEDDIDFMDSLDDEEDEKPPFIEPAPTVSTKEKRSKVVNIHTTTQLKVVVMQLESFDEARDIADHLKSKKPVVINLESVERDVARRIVDFLSGTVYALDGNIQKVSSGIFLVAPYNVGIMGDFKDELKNTGIFPWSEQ